MTTTETQPQTITIRRTGVPARQVPAGMWIDVLDVLRAHGLDASPTEVTGALAHIARHTPVDKGGRLMPDGRVDTSDYPDMEPSWFCTECWRDLYSQETKDTHDLYCEKLRAAPRDGCAP